MLVFLYPSEIAERLKQIGIEISGKNIDIDFLKNHYA
jgi:hypothetical protein